MMSDQESQIREVLLIGRLSHATGCSADEALQLLRDNNWQLEAAISAWFTPSESPLTVCLPMYHAQSASQQIPQVTSQQHQALCPCNTPATPASFTDTIHAFQKMDWWDNFSDDAVSNLSDNRGNGVYCSSATNFSAKCSGV